MPWVLVLLISAATLLLVISIIRHYQQLVRKEIIMSIEGSANIGYNGIPIGDTEMYYSNLGVAVNIKEVDGQVVLTVKNTNALPEIVIQTIGNKELQSIQVDKIGATFKYE
jgi:hypothetical protein